MASNAFIFANKIKFLTGIQSSPVADSNLQDFVDVFTLPAADGTSDQVLKTDGSGIITFGTVSAGGIDSASVTSIVTTTVDSAYVTSKLTTFEIYTRTAITADSGQTVFSATYTPNYVDVHLNGVKILDSADFVATNGTSVTLNTASETGDIVEITAWTPTAIVGGSSGATSTHNKIINGNFDIWQRGTSQTTSGYGPADRWKNTHVGSTKTASQQEFILGQTDVPNNPKYFLRHEVTSVSGSSNYAIMQQLVENVTTLSGQTATLSFWAKADSAKNIAVEFFQSFGTGGTPSTTVNEIGSQLIALTTSWTKYTVTVSIPSVSGKTLGTDGNDFLGLVFWFDAGSSFDARSASLGQQSGTFDIAQVQLEEGATANPFQNRTLGEELQLCQRYYQYCGTGIATSAVAILWLASTTSARLTYTLTTPLRATPSWVIISDQVRLFYDTNRIQTITSVNNINYFGGRTVGMEDTVTSGLNGGTGVVVTAGAQYFDAEL